MIFLGGILQGIGLGAIPGPGLCKPSGSASSQTDSQPNCQNLLRFNKLTFLASQPSTFSKSELQLLRVVLQP